MIKKARDHEHTRLDRQRKCYFKSTHLPLITSTRLSGLEESAAHLATATLPWFSISLPMIVLTICWPSVSLAKSPLFCFVYHLIRSSSVTSTLAFSLSLRCWVSAWLILLYIPKAIESCFGFGPDCPVFGKVAVASCFGFEPGAVLPLLGEVVVIVGLAVLLVIVVLGGGVVGLVGLGLGEALPEARFVSSVLGVSTASVSMLRKSFMSYSALLL